MNQITLAADILERNLGMLNMTLADFSDADMITRPCPGANHAAWQLGHLISAETRMINTMKAGAAAELPAGFDSKFTKETCSNDDAAFFPKKAALLEQLAKTRAASVAWAKSLTQADLDKPGPERMASMAPTIGHMVAMVGLHTMMHIGQFQVIRRKLGKPILF
jgi:DinB superfamily